MHTNTTNETAKHAQKKTRHAEQKHIQSFISTITHVCANEYPNPATEPATHRSAHQHKQQASQLFQEHGVKKNNLAPQQRPAFSTGFSSSTLAFMTPFVLDYETI